MRFRGSLDRFRSKKPLRRSHFFAQFPTQINRENISKNREFSSSNREFRARRAKPTFGRISIGKLNDGILADLPRTRSWRANYPVMIATGRALAQHQALPYTSSSATTRGSSTSDAILCAGPKPRRRLPRSPTRVSTHRFWSSIRQKPCAHQPRRHQSLRAIGFPRKPRMRRSNPDRARGAPP